jgi:NDP-sugar pyrophosphorylase family protein/aminoglycoside/choline kinase family phosphotransferase
VSKINAFIPAAGYGERLRPITDHIPKPLLPILGRPVMDVVLDRISTLSPDSIGINMHHQWEQIRAWAGSSPYAGHIRLFHENAILGTGGALKYAEKLLRESDFIVHNSDILTDINLSELAKKHFESNNIATLAIHRHHKFSNVWIDKKGNLIHVGKDRKEQNSGLCKVAFMGIAVYSPEFLEFLPKGKSSVVDAWLKVIAKGHSIGIVDFSGAAWTDIGTPDSYATAVFDLMKREGEAVYIHESLDCSRIEVGGNAVIEQGVFFDGTAFVRSSILLPGARIPQDSFIDHLIAGPGFTVDLDQSLLAETPHVHPSLLSWFGNMSQPVSAVCIGTGGSDRSYYRLTQKDKTAILMTCSETDQDYLRHIAYTLFFRKYSLPIPEIFLFDEGKKQALFEDLGDLSLYSWLRCSRSPGYIEGMYKKILDMLLTLQTTATDHLSECPLLQERVFDYDHLRWETSYFLERFVLGIKEININKGNELETEFDSLAKKVDAQKKTIVHRDFQSQNIMVTRGDVPRLIDYQGARIGPSAYDIASMLWDPYYRIEESMRARLHEYYIGRMKALQPEFDEASFRQDLLYCRLQRHMQALGAYGFLSKVKGKKFFLRYVPQAIAYLKEETILTRDEYPTVHDLVRKLA